MSNGCDFIGTVWKVMEICFQILLQEKRVTQRELFYKLLCDSPDYFSSQIEVNRTVQGQSKVPDKAYFYLDSRDFGLILFPAALV